MPMWIANRVSFVFWSHLCSVRKRNQHWKSNLSLSHKCDRMAGVKQDFLFGAPLVIHFIAHDPLVYSTHTIACRARHHGMAKAHESTQCNYHHVVVILSKPLSLSCQSTEGNGCLSTNMGSQNQRSDRPIGQSSALGHHRRKVAKREAQKNHVCLFIP